MSDWADLSLQDKLRDYYSKHGNTLNAWFLKAAWERLDQLERELAAAQAKIDALMLEYCPDEMTKEQIDNWKQHQKSVAD